MSEIQWPTPIYANPSKFCPIFTNQIRIISSPTLLHKDSDKKLTLAVFRKVF